MHFPVQIKIFDTNIYLHVLLEIVAFAVGYRYFLFLRKGQGDHLSTKNRLWVIIGATFGALIGSRLIGGFENPPDLFHSENFLIYFYQNKTVVGGFLGGLFGVELIKKIVHEQQTSGDLFTYPMILALIIGRIGCFSMGVYEETYGTASTVPWAMNLGDGVLRHPVALYEIFFLICTWVFLIQIVKKYKLNEGARFKIFMILYLTFRFTLDFIKPHFTYSIGLSTIQLTCAAGLIYYLPFIIRPKKLLLFSKI